VVVPASAVFAVPDSISDDVAAQLLINSITALEMLRTGHDSLPRDAGLSPFVLITAAASSVNRLVAGIALGLGVRPILLVRSEEGAVKLRAKSSNVPVISTAANNWKDKIASELDGTPLYCAFDAVGGVFLNDIASVLSDGATIVSVGWQGEGTPDLSMFAPRGLAIKGVSLGRWGINNDSEQRAKHVETAIKLGVTSPQLFEVEAQYNLSDFQLAIDHVFRPGKSGVVILNS
jgi:NADPH:quinone reductase-like Zn-dependent oxidoreductase